MDLAETTIPKSDQLNFDDVATTSYIVTIEKVSRGSAEQPVNVELVEFPGRPYRPSKSMRRVMIAAWTSDTGIYAGRQMRLYGDPEVMFGGVKVGGIKISHMSHIDKRLTVSLTATRGKRAPHVVEPLVDTTPKPAATKQPTAAQVAASTDRAELGEMWKATTDKDLRAVIETRVADLDNPATPDPASDAE